jgi:ATP-dependent DNA helicase RecG
MHRLLQGDVGSGKTVVAALAGLSVVEDGGQVALMAPTEILSEQHAGTLRRIAGPLGVSVTLLTGAMKPSDRTAALNLISEGRPGIVVGTHALLENDVVFRDLALAVVDEQHRFGVSQRAALRAKGAAHLLVMTATPIPRSLALTLYGDLDVTLLDELPPGRGPVRTGCRGPADRAKALAFLKEEVSRGRQGFVVCPHLDRSEVKSSKAARATYEELAGGPLSGLRLGLLHGGMKPEARARVMAEFREGRTDVLVATTVVEVGLDVANASVMLVEHAELFGLLQLHQLRGRIGRGRHPGYCILLADPDEPLTEEARLRLQAMCQTTDGFEIAERDLRIRGAGDLFGTRQAGLNAFRFADLPRDGVVIEAARDEAARLLSDDPFLARFPALQGRVAAFSTTRRDAEGAG